MKKVLPNPANQAKRKIERNNVKQIMVEVAGLIMDSYPDSEKETALALSKKILMRIKQMCFVDYGYSANRCKHPGKKKT